MKLWVDAQLSPRLATGLAETFAQVTKDSDFVLLQAQLGSPPSILWLTCGNTSNAHLFELLSANLPEALELLRRGEELVEIGGRRTIR